MAGAGRHGAGREERGGYAETSPRLLRQQSGWPWIWTPPPSSRWAAPPRPDRTCSCWARSRTSPAAPGTTRSTWTCSPAAARGPSRAAAGPDRYAVGRPARPGGHRRGRLAQRPGLPDDQLLRLREQGPAGRRDPVPRQRRNRLLAGRLVQPGRQLLRPALQRHRRDDARHQRRHGAVDVFQPAAGPVRGLGQLAGSGLADDPGDVQPVRRRCTERRW